MTKEGNKKIIKKIFIFMTIVMLIFLFGIFINYFAITSKTNLSDTKLTHAITSSSFQILDQNNQEIDISNTSQIAKIDSIKQHTIDAFLTSEDRNFYSHKGIDYKRLIGALLKNIKSGKLKQGGSTISQQLIKNTHLSSEKTLERKMKEFKLTKQLEKNYSKNQIIELYLNTIYFGNGNYGIEEASQSYFGKSAKNLSIAESAMLAGIISAPSYNEPVSHHATAEKKKNIILKNMQKLGKINEIQYKNAKNEQIVIKNNNNTSINQFIKSVISNASKILNISENQIRNKDIKIVTSLDKKLDSFLNKLVCNKSFSPINETGTTPIVESIIINNKTHQVISYATNQSHNIEGMRRQPGSSIKPILVYAPAFETNKASLNSQILDEKISFGDYCPKNSNDKYLGWTTIQTAIEKSLNIPAIKTLSYVGTTNALNFAKNLGIKFDEKDNHLAIALGGMTHGTTLKELADAYSTFSNEGNFSESGFITKIIDNKSRVIYNYNPKHKRVMSKNTASTITEALIGTVKHGTAKKLKIDGIEIASKTGTTNQNKEAWNICYTPQYTIATLICNFNHSALNSDVNGSTYPTLINREIIKELYKNKNPESFNLNIKSNSSNTEKQNKTNLNKENYELNNQIKLSITVENKINSNPKLTINSHNSEKLTIYKIHDNKVKILREFNFPDEQIELFDTDINRSDIIEYYAIAENKNNSITSSKIKIKIY